MKKTGTVIVLAVMFLLSAFNAYAKDAAVDPVSQADAIVAKINSVTDVKEAVKLLDSAYAMYKKAAETAGKEGLPENVYYQLAQYANYKYHHMDIGTVDEKKKGKVREKLEQYKNIEELWDSTPDDKWVKEVIK